MCERCWIQLKFDFTAAVVWFSECFGSVCVPVDVLQLHLGLFHLKTVQDASHGKAWCCSLSEVGMLIRQTNKLVLNFEDFFLEKIEAGCRKAVLIKCKVQLYLSFVQNNTSSVQ